MIIKGHILQLFSDSGKRYFLSKENVLLKDFAEYAEKITKALRENIEKTYQHLGVRIQDSGFRIRRRSIVSNPEF